MISVRSIGCLERGIESILSKKSLDLNINATVSMDDENFAHFLQTNPKICISYVKGTLKYVFNKNNTRLAFYVASDDIALDVGDCAGKTISSVQSVDNDDLALYILYYNRLCDIGDEPIMHYTKLYKKGYHGLVRGSIPSVLDAIVESGLHDSRYHDDCMDYAKSKLSSVRDFSRSQYDIVSDSNVRTIFYKDFPCVSGIPLFYIDFNKSKLYRYYGGKASDIYTFNSIADLSSVISNSKTCWYNLDVFGIRYNGRLY